MPRSGEKKQKAEDPAVTNFREYIRIKSVPPKIDYAGCVAFLQKQAESLSLPWKVVECVKGKPIFYITWEGSQPSLPSILLNSHTDVVPVYPEHWDYDPFEAKKDDEGNIYGRGTQDMKCVGIQYIEAIRRLKEQGRKFQRTIHLSFVPDEEIGGHDGMMKFVQTKEFQKLNVGFALDEGMANPTDAFYLYYGERAIWQVKFVVPGNPGHASRFIEKTAGEKLDRLVTSFMTFREKEKKRLESDSSLCLGDVTTVNLTMLEGGVQANVVPSELSLVFDCRVSHSTGTDSFEKMFSKWCKEAGDGITYSFLQKADLVPCTDISDKSQWWKAFKGACDSMKLKLKCEVFPAATDSRYLRELNIPALGFSPMNKTPILLHDHNEFLNEEIFLKGIEIYCNIIPAVADLPAQKEK